MRKIIFLFIGLGLLMACSDQKDENMDQAIETGKSFKEAVYTVKYGEIPDTLPDRLKYLEEKVKPYLAVKKVYPYFFLHKCN